MYKYESIANIIKNHLSQFEGTKDTFTITAQEVRNLNGVDQFAENTCYPNMARAMEFVSENYYPGEYISGVKGSNTFTYRYKLR